MPEWLAGRRDFVNWRDEPMPVPTRVFAGRLQALADAGRLELADARTAADQFFALTTYQADRITLNGVHDITIAELEPGIRSSIAMFLDSYSPRS